MCNARYLMAHEAAIQLDQPASACNMVTALLEDPARLDQLRQRIREIAHPDSALQTAHLVMGLADHFRSHDGFERTVVRVEARPVAHP